jgi:hypothetical protein
VKHAILNGRRIKPIPAAVFIGSFAGANEPPGSRLLTTETVAAINAKAMQAITALKYRAMEFFALTLTVQRLT